MIFQVKSPASMPAIPDSLRNSPALKLLTRTPKSFKCLQDKATGQLTWLTWESKGPTPPMPQEIRPYWRIFNQHCFLILSWALLGQDSHKVFCREHDSSKKNPCQYQTSTAVWPCVLTFASFGDCLGLGNNGASNSRSRRVICFLF